MLRSPSPVAPTGSEMCEGTPGHSRERSRSISGPARKSTTVRMPRLPSSSRSSSVSVLKRSERNSAPGRTWRPPAAG